MNIWTYDIQSLMEPCCLFQDFMTYNFRTNLTLFLLTGMAFLILVVALCSTCGVWDMGTLIMIVIYYCGPMLECTRKSPRNFPNQFQMVIALILRSIFAVTYTNRRFFMIIHKTVIHQLQCYSRNLTSKGPITDFNNESESIPYIFAKWRISIFIGYPKVNIESLLSSTLWPLFAHL